MPKIIGDSLADHRQMTRHRLFEALGQLMSEGPFDSITMSQIAARADVGRTAVYNHFADKETLLLEFMHYASGQFTQVLRTALEGQSDPIEQMRIYLRAHLELKDRYHLASGVNLRGQVSMQTTPRLREHAGMIEDVLLKILRSAMGAEAIPLQNPYMLIGLIHSALAGQNLPSSAVEREHTIRAVQAFILRAIGVPAEKAPIPSSRIRPAEEDLTLRSDAQAFLRCPVSHG